MSYRWVKSNLFAVIILLFTGGCHYSNSKQSNYQPTSDSTVVSPVSAPLPTATPDTTRNKPNTTPIINNAKLVDIQSVNKNIVVDIRYATSNNFLKRKVYPEARCILRYRVAKKLAKVQEDLAKNQLGLKVYDCYRPLSVQKLMWQVKPDNRFVANPAQGSRHNRGAAVDLTLVDSNGKELEMPSEFDSFTPASHRNYSGGNIQALHNRQLLENAMQKHGFIGLSTEWWHFDASGWKDFPSLDVPFNQIPRS
ncbi:MAG: M15 family metallopeptidase [Scytonematopsis contorta HA4267-MV1]|jgi:D-alanyl-D-alanine dipeptidase|nr:M15 family metallopeptidase [Scytonematopsis contorta HA4267-MV1]